MSWKVNGFEITWRDILALAIIGIAGVGFLMGKIDFKDFLLVVIPVATAYGIWRAYRYFRCKSDVGREAFNSLLGKVREYYSTYLSNMRSLSYVDAWILGAYYEEYLNTLPESAKDVEIVVGDFRVKRKDIPAILKDANRRSEWEKVFDYLFKLATVEGEGK